MSSENTLKFNPVKEDTGTLASQRIVWTTESINIAKNAIEHGKRLVATPFHENDTRKLRRNLVYQRTEQEIDEWKRCRDDIVYFGDTYCKLMTPEGIRKIILRDYQRSYLKHLQDNRLSIMLSCRQAGKTTTSAIELLHYLVFNTDKMGAVLGNKLRTAKEILRKTKNIFLELPYFLKPGIEKWNESEVLFDNGCMCTADSTTDNPNLGDTLSYVLLDEFAHVPPNIAEKFYNQIFPTITAAKAKLRITSTQNGHNLFYRLYKGAVEETNEYKPFKVDWYDVPEWNPEKREWEKRDEVWFNNMVGNLGGEEEFNKQFGTNFIVNSNTLVSKTKLARLQTHPITFISKDMNGVILSDSWRWSPDLDLSDLKNKTLIITCDLAEQLGQDFTIYSVYELLQDHHMVCIGFFRDNTNTRESCALSFIQFITIYCNCENILVSHERNTYGDLWLKDLKEQASKNNIDSFEMNCFVRYYNESNTSWKHGVKITRGNKYTHCLLLKEELEIDRIINNSHLFINELENFGEVKQGVFRATCGHDDLIMSAVQLTFVKETIQYKLLSENIGITNDNIGDLYSGLSNNYFQIPFTESNYEQSQGLYNIPTESNEHISRLIRYSK